jgi:hypothetical protein
MRYFRMNLETRRYGEIISNRSLDDRPITIRRGSRGGSIWLP